MFYGDTLEDEFGAQGEISAVGSTIVVISNRKRSTTENEDNDSYFRFYRKDTNGNWALFKNLDRVNNGWAIARLIADGNTFILGERYYRDLGTACVRGRVEIYEFDGNTPPNAIPKGQSFIGSNCGDVIGTDVGLSLDGNVMTFIKRGLPSRVGVYDFNSSTNRWDIRGNEFTIKASPEPVETPYFPTLKLSDDGSTIMLGQPVYKEYNPDLITGSIRVYSWNDTNQAWEQIGSDLHSDQPFNTGFGYYPNTMTMNRAKDLIAMSAITYDKQTYDPGTDTWSSPTAANRKGKIWIYELINGEWSLQDELRGEGTEEYFGWGIEFNAAGNVLAVGSNQGSKVQLFQYDGSWTKQGGDITPGDLFFGQAVGLDETGTILAVGASIANNESGVKTGLIRVYEW